MQMRIHHIAILASQRERTVAFYADLGFEVRESHARPERGDEIVFMQREGMTLEVFVSAGNPPRASGPEAYGLRHLAFSVDDVEGTHTRLIELGRAPEPVRRDQYTGERMFFIKDPDGTPIEIRE